MTVRPRFARWLPRLLTGIALPALLIAACDRAPGGDDAQHQSKTDSPEAVAQALLVSLNEEFTRIDSVNAQIDDLFRPLPLLTPTQEQGLRQYPNASQLARARALGPGRNLSDDQLARLEREGDLVRLEDGPYWVIGDLTRSQPLVIPAMRDLLEEVGRRFQQRLAELGAPPLRFEISSVLRSAADQAALRASNPNATLGESTHEHATTVDVLYSAFAGPLESLVEPADLPVGGGEVVRRYAAVSIERVAGRRALELKRIFGEVLLELQREGRVMVTLERQQPVFHMTVAQ